MGITQRYVVAVECEHVEDNDTMCTSRLFSELVNKTEAEIRVAVAEHGWDGEKLLCPKHRSKA